MKFRRSTLADCHEAAGIVVVIDVLRAFTTAAWAFHRGARSIAMATTVEEALALRDDLPGAQILGEVDALPVAGFDFPNSPSAVADARLHEARLIQRTTAGTQGMRRSASANHLFAASLVVASATAAAIRGRQPESVTFVETGRRAGDWGDEDAACADYIEGLLRREPPNRATILERVRASRAGRRFADPGQPDFPAEDLRFALDLDRFDFAMVAERRNGCMVLLSIACDDGESL